MTAPVLQTALRLSAVDHALPAVHRISDILNCVCTQGGWTQYDPANVRLDIRHSIPSMQAQHAASLAPTIGHEYTHYLEHMYGWTSDGHFGAVHEGIADSMGVRFAAWKKAIGAWPTLTYQSALGLGFAYQYHQALRNGEYRIEHYPNPFGPIDTYLYLDPSLAGVCYDPCITNPNTGCYYQCGQIYQNIYWALAFNQCRLSYLSCTNGLSLLFGIGYWQNRPAQVASDAFSYAMAAASNSVTLHGFLDLVAARYAQRYAAGHITLTELQRVESLLASHCAGPSNVCNYNPKNPDSPLPRAYTVKKDYYEAEAGVLFSPAQSVSNPARSASAWLRLQSSGTAIYTVQLTQSGMYRFNFLADVTGSTEDEVNALAFDGRNWRNVGPLPHTGYKWYARDAASEKFCAWSNRPTTLLLSTLPSHMADFRVDVLVLERTGNLEGSCVLQCSAGFQGCPNGMSCVSGVCQ